MTELKTLKDLKENYIGESHRDGVINGFKDELKQEAIKWVKAKKFGNFEFCSDEEIATGLFYECEPWIKIFFNLTEEDLK